MRVLLVDDHPSWLRMLADAVRTEFPGAEVRRCSELQRAIVEAAGKPQFDLVAIDLALPGCNACEAAERLLDKHPALRVAVVSGDESPLTMAACLRLGACAYVPKRYSPEMIAGIFRVVVGGGTSAPKEILDAARRDKPAPKLSTRERQVLRLMLKGYSNKRIANEFGISVSTVKQHVGAIYTAFDVSTRSELLASIARGRLITE